MLHFEDKEIQGLLLKGSIGLEKENLRVTKDGFMARTAHPFPEDEKYIIRDFCENQTEINTEPLPDAVSACRELTKQTKRIEEKLKQAPEKEYLWCFSNPPYIRNEGDIPIARFHGENAPKTEYREYLADRYGRYKMTFSGIHFNYSFSDELLKADFERSGEDDFRSYKDALYLSLSAKAQAYNWLVVAVTAASPLLDSSYFEKESWGKDVYNGMASTRCSELGYWNFFTPILDYSDIGHYTDSIRSYIDEGLIRSSSELYYPVRLKPKGAYSLNALKEKGADHIELRMVDLNPFEEAGIDERDVFFLQLLLIYLACQPDKKMDIRAQIEAIADTKNAARYDLKTVHLTGKAKSHKSIAKAARRLISDMTGFFRDFGDDGILSVLKFERDKFVDMENRYAYKVRERFSGGFVEKGMEMLKSSNL